MNSDTNRNSAQLSPLFRAPGTGPERFSTLDPARRQTMRANSTALSMQFTPER